MPENVTNVHVPQCLWAQRDDIIYLTIAVEDVDKPDVKLEDNTLLFKGSAHNQNYELNIEFFKPINKEESKWGVYAQKHWMFILKKQEKGPYWPRLLKESKRVHWLKADWNKWKDEDDEDEEENGPQGAGDFDSMFRQMGGLGGMGGMEGMGGMGGMGGMDDLPDLNDMEEKEDSDDEKLPDLEENTENKTEA